MSGDGLVLALDVGTSSCRASLYDLRGRAVPGRFAHVTYTPTVTADGGAQLDPELLLREVYQVIDNVLAAPLTAPIRAVATTTFWHSLLGLDARGKALTPIYPWLDARSLQDVAALRQRLDERAIHARTGCVLHWTYWPAKLVWLKRTQPKLFERVDQWVSFGAFLLERVTGQRHETVSMASGTGLLDVHTCGWDRELLGAVELTADQLAPIAPAAQTSAARAALTQRWPALRDVPWLAALGDGACSNVGAGCTTPAHVAIMIGTSGAERVVWAPPDTFTIPWGTWCYRLDERRLVIGGALNDGGSLFDWLHASLRLPPLSASERAVGLLAPDSHGLTVLPFWGGERSPGWSSEAHGAVIGLRLHTRPLEILRACLEAVALRFGEIDHILQQALAGDGEIVGTGGALLHSSAWLQILADVLNRPVLASAEAEASSRGAALMALETLGLLTAKLENVRPHVRARYHPRPAHTAIYRAAAERQRRLYDALIV